MRELRRAAHRVLDFGGIGMRLRGGGQFGEQQISVAADHGEQVVEVVGHATGEATDRLELLGLAQLFHGHDLRGDVGGVYEEPRHAAVDVAQGLNRHVDMDVGAAIQIVGAQVHPRSVPCVSRTEHRIVRGLEVRATQGGQVVDEQPLANQIRPACGLLDCFVGELDHVLRSTQQHDHRWCRGEQLANPRLLALKLV